MEDDFYVFDAARNNLVGRRTRRMIRLGDNFNCASGQGGHVQKAGGLPAGWKTANHSSGPAVRATNAGQSWNIYRAAAWRSFYAASARSTSTSIPGKSARQKKTEKWRHADLWIYKESMKP